jgi:hypothetical protein
MTFPRSLDQTDSTSSDEINNNDDDDDDDGRSDQNNNFFGCNDRYEAPEPFQWLHGYCADCNPPVPESPDPLVAMTWSSRRRSQQIGFEMNHSQLDRKSHSIKVEALQQLQIQRIYHPLSYKIFIPKTDGTTTSDGGDDHYYITNTATATETILNRDGGTTRRSVAVEGADKFFAPSNPSDRIHRRLYTAIDRPNHPGVGRDGTSSASLKIYQNCTIILDWGVERAAWMELLSPSQNFDYIGTNRKATTQQHTSNLERSNHSTRIQVLASISEFNQPYPDKTFPLTQYGNYTYRLETNTELYEGVRFSFLQFIFPTFVDGDGDKDGNGGDNNDPFVEITDLSLVSKIKPVNYVGSFSSSDPILTQAWYTGAYGVRLNMEENDLNSVLVERGDRVAIQGDGHPTIDAALVAFAPYSLIRNVLNQTDSSHKHVVDDAIMAYPLYWCLSAIDYFMASADSDLFVTQLAPDIMILLDKRIDDFLDPHLDITWFGWDDRLGNGWCFHSKNNDTCTSEALWSFAGLVIRVCKDLIRALKAANMSEVAIQKYEKATLSMTLKLRNLTTYPDGFGVHAAANAINAGISTVEETDQWLKTTLNDAVTICSFSQFNQYWILQSFGNIGTALGMEYALASIKLCWGPMLELGRGCFWEISSPEWLRFMKDGDQAPHLPSYCHPWASGVTPWLSHMAGGLQPLTPGYKTFVAMPYVSMRYHSISTTIGTPHGPIAINASLVSSLVPRNEELSHLRSASSTAHDPFFIFEAHVECSQSVSGILGVRLEIFTGVDEDVTNSIAAYLNFDSIRVDGEKAKIAEYDHIREMVGETSQRRVDQHVYIKLEGGHKHRVMASYSSGSFKKPVTSPLHDSMSTERAGPQRGWRGSPFPEPRYAGSIDPFDRVSQGDGLLQYGQDGYVLLGCNETGNDIVNLPHYISDVTLRRHGYPGWIYPDRAFVGTSESNPIYLPVDRIQREHEKVKNQRKETNPMPIIPREHSTNATRALGRVGFNDVNGGDINCLFVDVKVEDGYAQPYSLSVYFVGLTDDNRHAIRVMDGSTFNVIAPTTLVSDYMNGLWWTLHYSTSVRLKLMDLRGIHVSAVAFRSDLKTYHYHQL